MSVEDNIKKGKKVAMICTLATIALALSKGLIGFLSGSVSLIADAFHSVSDIFIIFATWVGFKISQKKPDEKFPYGYYKAETFASLLVSIFIIGAAVFILKDSISFFGKSPELKFGYAALSVSLLSAIISYLISVYEIKVGKEINSSALLLNGYESRTDVLTSSIVFIGVLSSYFGIKYVEGIVGAIIALILIKYGLSGLYESVLILMDASPDSKVENKLKEIIMSVDYVKGIKSIKMRKSGMVLFGDVSIFVKGNINVERANEIAEDIKKRVKSEIKEINDLNISVIPEKKKDYVIAVPVSDPDGKELSDNFSRSNYFGFIHVNDNKINGIKVVPNPYKQKKSKTGLSIGKFLSDKSDIVITKNIGEISYHVLRDNFIDIYRALSSNVNENIKKFMEGKLEQIKKPTREVE